MGKHDLKAKEIQVNSILSKEVTKISTGNVLTQDGTFEYDQFDLVPRWFVELLLSNGVSLTIPKWSSLVATNIDVPIRHLIDGISYLFVSLEDGNTTEPTLNSSDWNKTDLYFSGAYNGLGILTYPFGAIVSSGGIAYSSLQDNNTNHNPASSPTWWEPVGSFEGDFNDVNTYDLDDVVLDPEDVDGFGNKAVYISNVNGNTSPLSVTSWQLVGAQSATGNFLPISGGNMTGPINFNDANAGYGVRFSKNTDNAAVYFESTSDSAGDSNIVIEIGDNLDTFGGLTEGLIVRKKVIPGDVIVELLKVNPIQFQYMGKEIRFAFDLDAYSGTDIDSDSGELTLTADDQTLVGTKTLIGIRVDLRPINVGLYDPATGKVSGLGGEESASSIILTFI